MCVCVTKYGFLCNRGCQLLNWWAENLLNKKLGGWCFNDFVIMYKHVFSFYSYRYEITFAATRFYFEICWSQQHSSDAWRHHQMETFSPYWPFVREIHRSPVNSPHKGQCHGAMIFYSVCAWLVIWDAIAPTMTSLLWTYGGETVSGSCDHIHFKDF